MRRLDFIVRGVLAWLFAVSAALPAQADVTRPRTVSAKTAPGNDAATERTAVTELRRSLRQALSQPFRAEAADVQRQARDFVDLYRRTAQSPLSACERGRWQARLRGRLIGLRKVIAREVASQRQSEAAAGSSTQKARTPEPRPVKPGARGGAPRSNAQDLIDLIQNTIAPESWDVNGGRGTIAYWEPGFALVVRQTDDVHEEIGGVLRGLGK